MASTWESRDLPVLRAIVELSDEGVWSVTPTDIAERTGLEDGQVQIALRALAYEHPPFFRAEALVVFEEAEPQIDEVSDPTGHARRTVGTWPRAGDRVDQMTEVLEAVAESTVDSEEEATLRRAARFLGGLGRRTATDVFEKLGMGE